MPFSLRLSRARTGVVAMRQDSSYYNNCIPRNWGEKGVKFYKKRKKKWRPLCSWTFNAAVIFCYPSPDMCLDTILSRRSTDNSFDLMGFAYIDLIKTGGTL